MIGRARLAALLAIGLAVPGAAQQVPDADAPPQIVPQAPSPRDARPGSVAGSAAGQAGRRQTRDQEIGGIRPMTRIDSRIANRIQSRLRNRIGRDYDPQASTTAPFDVAVGEVRTTGSPRQR